MLGPAWHTLKKGSFALVQSSWHYSSASVFLSRCLQTFFFDSHPPSAFLLSFKDLPRPLEQVLRHKNLVKGDCRYEFDLFVYLLCTRSPSVSCIRARGKLRFLGLVLYMTISFNGVREEF